MEKEKKVDQQIPNNPATGIPGVGMLVDQYRKIREHAETYPYVWGSYIVVYGGLGLWFTYRWRKLRKTEDRVRGLQEKLQQVVREREASTSAMPVQKSVPSTSTTAANKTSSLDVYILVSVSSEFNCYLSLYGTTILISDTVNVRGGICGSIVVCMPHNMAELKLQQLEATEIRVDSKSAIELAKNLVHHERSKHIDVRFHFIREQVKEGSVWMSQVASRDQMTDILTKSLPPRCSKTTR